MSLPRWWVIGVLVAVVVAVPLMHIVVAVCTPAHDDHAAPRPAAQDAHTGAAATDVNGDKIGAPAGSAHAPMTPQMSMAPAAGTDATMQPTGCGGHTHACVFTPADDLDPLVVVLVLLVWGTLLLAGTVLPGHPTVRIFGRSPPWAMRSHLELQVIRC